VKDMGSYGIGLDFYSSITEVGREGKETSIEDSQKRRFFGKLTLEN
jgi:hypothetical protein